MTQSEIKRNILSNPSPIFDEEIIFDELIELTGIRHKSVMFNKKITFLKKAKFQGVDLFFRNAVFNESLTIENVSKITFINCSFNDIIVQNSQTLHLNFKKCLIKSIYFEKCRHDDDLTFENTIINEFKSLESDFLGCNLFQL